MRTIASGQRFAFLRAAADALFKFPPYPHDGGARSGRTIASGHRFAFLRAAADAAIADYVCSRCFVGRFVLNIRTVHDID